MTHDYIHIFQIIYVSYSSLTLEVSGGGQPSAEAIG